MHPFRPIYLFVFSGIITLTACQGGQSGSKEQSDTTNRAKKEKQKKPFELANYTKTGDIALPKGFKAKKIVSDLGYARHIAIRKNGDMYVALREKKNNHGTVALRDTTGDHKVDVVKYFGDFIGTGAAIRNGYLYRSSQTAVYRYPLAEGQLLPKVGERETIVKNMPDQNSHAAKPIDFDRKGNLYVNVGAPSNACMKESRTKGSPGMDPCPLLKKHGGIWRYKADMTEQKHQAKNRYATGMRNIVALDFNNAMKDLFVVQHGRDQLGQFFPDMYNDEQNAKLPAEEFHRVNEGDHLGWPYCYYDQIQQKKVLGPEYGGDSDSVGRCSKFQDPLVGFPGHWGPNDLLFYNDNAFPTEYQNGAFIAFHGSWNRAPLPQAGYNVAFVPFDDGELVDQDEWFVFAKGFKGKEPLKSPRKAEHRPMGLAIGPEGVLYITDSQGGTVWRITYEG